jgi:ketosteroid isomerase-like protein
MKADPKVEREILSVLDQAAQLYGRNQADQARQYFLNEDDITVINTGIDEEAIGWEQIKAGAQRDFEQTQSQENKITWKRRWVSVRDNVAWVNGEAQAQIELDGRPLAVDSRFTGVFCRDDGQWKIHTLHFSLPHPEQPAGQSWPRPEATVGKPGMREG